MSRWEVKVYGYGAGSGNPKRRCWQCMRCSDNGGSAGLKWDQEADIIFKSISIDNKR